MLRGSKVAFGCVAAFLLPFMAIGLTFIVIALLGAMRGQASSDYLPMLLGGTAFLAVSGGMFAAAIRSARSVAQVAALHSSNPGKPWLWRKDWAEGVIVDQSRASSVMLVVFAVVWNAISLPILFLIDRKEIERTPFILVAVIFPAVGVIMAAVAAYRVLQARKYGLSRLTLDRIPIQPGVPFRGELVTRVHQLPPEGFVLKLTCVRAVTTGGGKSRSTSETILWRDEKTVAAGAAMPTPEGARVPIAFTIDGDAQSTDERNAADRLFWRLDVEAAVPGIDYSARFELPVFDTGTAPHAVVAHEFSESEVEAWQPSPASHVTITPQPDGTREYRIGGSGRVRDIAAMLVFGFVWWGVVVLMVKLHAPILFPLLFGGFGVLLLVMIVDTAAGKSVIRAGRQGLTAQRTWFGAGPSRQITRDAIAAIRPAIGMTTGGGSGTPYYQLEVQFAAGGSISVARAIRSRKDAEMLAAHIARDLGLPSPGADREPKLTD